MTPERMAALVTRWVRFYVRDLPTPIAARRVHEIDADLHDHIAHERASGTSDRRIGLSILSRMVRGVAADVSWRDQHAKIKSEVSVFMQQPVTGPSASRPRPLTVTILAILAAVGGIGAVLGVLAGAFVIHGLDSLDATDAVIVIPALILAALYLAFAYGAWTLRSWGWTLGVGAAASSIVYITAILVRDWAELMRDAPPLAWMSVLVAIIAAVGLFFWFRPDVKAAFGRA